ncbi:sensor of ECF-type sigma factor [Flavobacterium sp. 3HN19-14]|uniref:sensor of ECF-type sigma factor n=1 Tax=Flavobacterium sp. 3HN19-14 TaxID=3448133 RepID=UPI003EE1A8F4
MKTVKIFTLLLLFASGISFAQGGKIVKEKVKALKVAFITKELDLSSAEAEKFWPVFNEFDDKQFELKFKKMRALKDKLDNLDTMGDKDAQSLLAQFENVEDELAQNRKKLIQNLKGVISPVKILKLKKAEDDFNKKLLKQYRGKGDKGDKGEK